EYVEVAVDYATARGYTLYQRGTTPSAEINPDTLPEDPRLRFSGPNRFALATLKIQVDAPVGTSAVVLYLDGRPYRQIDNPGLQSVQTSFFVLAGDLTAGDHVLRAVAH